MRHVCQFGIAQPVDRGHESPDLGSRGRLLDAGGVVEKIEQECAEPRGGAPRIEREGELDCDLEVPRAFVRQFQGRMPLMRVGWGMIRPRAQPTAR